MRAGAWRLFKAYPVIKLAVLSIAPLCMHSYSRELILVWSNLFAAVVVACFTLIQRASHVW